MYMVTIVYPGDIDNHCMIYPLDRSIGDITWDITWIFFMVTRPGYDW